MGSAPRARFGFYLLRKGRMYYLVVAAVVLVAFLKLRKKAEKPREDPPINEDLLLTEPLTPPRASEPVRREVLSPMEIISTHYSQPRRRRLRPY